MGDNAMGSDGAEIVALTADLLFAVRIRGAAPAARAVQRLEAVEAALGPGTRVVVVDMQAREAVAAIGAARRRAPGAAVVAFAPHVEADLLEAARAAGADRVMPRGAFVRDLREIVGRDPGRAPGG